MNTSDEANTGLVLLGAPAAWVIVLVIIPALLGFTALFYRMGRTPSPKARWFLAGLRALVVVLLAGLLMDPAFEAQIVERKPVLTVLLADSSASMRTRDDYSQAPALAAAVRAAAGLDSATPLGSVERIELARRVLDDGSEKSFLRELAKQHPVKLLSFGEKLSPASSFASVQADERATAIGLALQRTLDDPEVKSSPVGSIVLITDGRNTAGPAAMDFAEFARNRRIPVHCIGVGDPSALRNLKIVGLLAPAVSLLHDTVVIETRTRQRGLNGAAATLRLLVDGTVVEQQDFTFGAADEDRVVRLMHRPARVGQQEWVVELVPQPGEADTSDNRRTVPILVKDERIKVLYLETYPRWEYATLKDFLTRGEEAFDTHCLLLDADRGFPQESSARLPPLRELPESPEDLFHYDVIICGDVDPEGLGHGDPERARRFQQNLRLFVEQGGGFIMLSGERFSPGAWKDTPIAEILPVIIDSSESGGSGGDSGFHMRLTELGREHPVMQIVEDPARNRAIWEGGEDPLALAPLWWFAPVKKTKPGAMALALHASASNLHGAQVLLATGTYGEGPVLFSALDEMWRWYRDQGPFSHHRFFGNMVRFAARTRLLAGDKRFRLNADRSEVEQGARVSLSASVKDRAFLPATRETQEVVLREPSGRERRELLRRVENGRYERAFSVGELGEWSAWLPNEDGVSDERIAPLTFRVVLADAEQREPIMEEAQLRALAAATGGRYTGLEGARELLSSAASGTVEIPRQRRILRLRDKDSPWLQWIPAVLLVLLGVEWMVRKRQRLI